MALLDRKVEHGVDKGEQDLQRTSSRESNSGHRRHSCVICRRANREAIGTDKDPSLSRTVKGRK